MKTSPRASLGVKIFVSSVNHQQRASLIKLAKPEWWEERGHRPGDGEAGCGQGSSEEWGPASWGEPFPLPPPGLGTWLVFIGIPEVGPGVLLAQAPIPGVTAAPSTLSYLPPS